jgi:hypothetical protein
MCEKQGENILKYIKKITIYVAIIIVLITSIIFLSFKDVSIEQKIKDYYKVIDISKNVDKYNSLVTKDRRVKDLKFIPSIVEQRDIIELKQIDVNENKRLIDYLESNNKEEKNIKFVLVRYNITFKKGKNSPIDSGTYYQIVVFEKKNGKWLLNGDTFDASYTDRELSIDN